MKSKYRAFFEVKSGGTSLIEPATVEIKRYSGGGVVIHRHKHITNASLQRLIGLSTSKISVEMDDSAIVASGFISTYAHERGR
jgi:hypothetical protein